MLDQDPVVHKPFPLNYDYRPPYQSQIQVPIDNTITSPDDSPDFRNTERIVYQGTISGGDWEIFTQRGYESYTNISQSPGSDDNLPVINNSITRIAFNSNRSGKAQIYTMDLSGNNLTRITNNIYNDYAPGWFPDDSKLVFTSNRNNNIDIYRINIDGSGAVRLTTDAAADSGAAVSPDGTKIAWIRYSTLTDGLNDLWVMDADGSNKHEILANQHYLQNPAWSPDGIHIGFDCDCNGNEWNELAQVHTDGSNYELIYDFNADRFDLWMGGYSTTSNGIIYTLANWYENGRRLFSLPDNRGLDRISTHTP